MAESLVVNSIIFTYVELNYDQEVDMCSKGVEIICNDPVVQRECTIQVDLGSTHSSCLCGILVSPTGFFNYINMYFH